MQNQPFQSTDARQQEDGHDLHMYSANSPGDAGDAQQSPARNAAPAPQVIILRDETLQSRTRRRFNPWMFMALCGFVVFAAVAGVGLTMLANVQSGVHQNGQLLALTQTKLGEISQRLTDIRAQVTQISHQISQQIAVFLARAVSLLNRHAA